MLFGKSNYSRNVLHKYAYIIPQALVGESMLVGLIYMGLSEKWVLLNRFTTSAKECHSLPVVIKKNKYCHILALIVAFSETPKHHIVSNVYTYI